MIRSSAIWGTGGTPLHDRSVLILDTFIRGLMGVAYGLYLLIQQLVQILKQRRVKKDEITAPY